MTLHEIYELLSGKVKPDRSLLLEAGFFTQLAAVLKAFSLTQLQLTGAQVAEAGPVIVDGKAVMLGKKEGDVHLEFNEVPDTKAIVATLSFTAPSGWGFADGFPGLPSSYASSTSHPGFITLGDSVLYELRLGSAKVTGRSEKDELEFEGVIADKAYFTFLADPLKLPDKPPLRGTIRLRKDAAPEADLTVTAGSSTLTVGSLLTFDEVGVRTHTVAHDPSTDSALTRMDLDATLEVGSTDPVPVKLAAPFYGRSDLLGLSADFGQAGLSIDRGIKAFAELLRLPAADFTLPKPLDVLGKFALQTIDCVVTLDPPSVQRLVITVGPGEKWPIAKGIEVDDLTVGFAVAYPFDSNARWLSASISGRLALGTVDPRLEFDIFAATDNGFAASGELSHPITLAEIATTINGTPVPGLPELTVINAGVTATTTGEFGVVVSVGNWHIGNVGDTEIKLYEVTVEFERSAGALKGQFLTVFAVGKARLYLAAQITLGAAQPQAAGTSWVLEGGTQPDTEIEIGEFLKELDTFGIKKVPEPIRSLKLTALKLRYESAGSKFNFTATAKFKVEETEVTVTVTIDIAPTSEMEAAVNNPQVATVTGIKGHSAKFGGEVSFAGLRFNIVFDTEDEKTDVLIASYVHDAKATALRDLVEPISPEVAREIPPGISIDIKDVKFVFLKQTETRWAFGLRLGKSGISLSELPIVGSRLPADQTLAVDALQILYSSGDLDEKQTKIINPLLPRGVAKLPETVGKGIAFDADVILGSTTKHLHAGVTPPKPALPAGPVLPAGLELPAASGLPAAAANAPAAPASSTDPVKWLDVNKQFGVFSFERVGVGYQNNVLEFALDASVALGPVAFSMQGLSVGSPLTSFDPQFSINGLALAYDRPPLTLGGAFLKVKEKADGKEFTSYYGQVMVKMSRFGLSALGGWSPDADPAMFFLYLAIHAPIGGPPELYMTGLAGGFGVNSSLRLPTIDEVGGYQLLPANAPSPEGNAAETIKNVIPALQKTFRPKADQYWVAAGIELTSYEMIKAQAVVSVAFGVELQIGVVGTCSMTLPTSAGNAQPLAYLEIEVVASFTPSTGLLAIDGKISPASFIFGGFVKLTGGFAFYVWFSGEHQSDFVVSLGGYHPAFEKPGHYPVVPRLGVAFALGPIKVLGQAYFALTPGAFMAGIRITATFSAGPVSAWFDAGVDFLVRWAPLHYEAAAWVTIGCSVDLGLFSIKVQVGANVQIWGPDFGGTADVDLDVVSFTIAFGAKNTQPLPVGWKTFSANFLPAPQKPPERLMALAAGARDAAAALGAAEPPEPVTNVIKATVEAGLISPGPAGVDWIVDPNHFRIRTDSTAPANHGVWATAEKTSDELPNVVANYRRVAPAPPLLEAAGEAGAAPSEMELLLDYETKTFSEKKVWAPKLNIAPMEVKDVKSFHTIALRKYDTKSGGYTRYITGVAVTPQLRSSSTALWGEQEQKPKPNAARLIKATLSGFAISPITRKPDQVSNVSLLSLIFGEGHDTGFRYQRPTVDSRYTVTSSITDKGTTFRIDIEGEHTDTLTNHDYVLSSVDEEWVRTQRASTLDELRKLGFRTLSSDEVHLTEMAKTPLTDWPSAGRIGALR